MAEVHDENVGKTVIRFITHGCMGHIDEFDYIGKITGIVYHKDKKFYKVEVLKQKSYEKGNGWIEDKFAEVPSWYLQNIGGDFLICYD